jgi:putative PEP-CTERM system histidine kinase
MMNPGFALAFAAACLSALLAIIAALRKQRSLATWCFSAGMLVFAIESSLVGIGFLADSAANVAFWQTLVLLAKSLVPGIWLCFSVVYARTNYQEFLARSRFLLIAAFLIPLCLLEAFYTPLFDSVSYGASIHGWQLKFASGATVLNTLVLISTVLILMNLERTFRSAVGTTRWRIKFLVLGLGVIFGARIYTRSQALLFSGYNLPQLNIETAALLVGDTMMGIAYFRKGLSEIDVYPSRAILQGSITLLLAGGYLLIVGVLAQLVAHFGGAAAFPLAALLVLLSTALLAVLLLSERTRQGLRLFVSRHFKRPRHDFRQIWAQFTRSISAVLDETSLCNRASRLISEAFNALSVSIWLFDNAHDQLTRASSTAGQGGEDDSPKTLSANGLKSAPVNRLSRPFDLEKTREKWAGILKEIVPRRFRTGGNRICIPLLSGEQWLGVIILADRVNGLGYTVEEMDLLKCIGDQVAASLLNLRLTNEAMEKKELEAFQAITAFFIHDLKNAASTLGLMLQNLPTHFDDPVFRQDALRGIGSAADRINNLVQRLNSLRDELQLAPASLDFNLLVTSALKSLDGTLNAEVITHLNPVPPIRGDREKLESVIINLLLNARDAVGAAGHIILETSQCEDCVTFSISDNGCGMTPEFVASSLFRPFRTTKKKGLGIGIFQARMIIEAHGGNIRVKSVPGVGTTFQLNLPLKSKAK